jgi:hypothetical protein
MLTILLLCLVLEFGYTEINMTQRLNIVISILTVLANTLGWIAQSQLSWLNQDTMIIISIISTALLGVVSQIAHLYNVDGTSQTQPYVK